MGLPRFNENSYAHFVTTKTWHDHQLFRNAIYCDIVVDSLHFYSKWYHYELIAYCVMPDHVHIIIQWDAEKHIALTISKIIQSIKSHSAKAIVAYQSTGRRKLSLSPFSVASKGSRLPNDYAWIDRGNVHTPSTHRIWQPSFYDFNIYNEKKLRQKIEYIHWNPIRAGLCRLPEEWLWSSENLGTKLRCKKFSY